MGDLYHGDYPVDMSVDEARLELAARKLAQREREVAASLGREADRKVVADLLELARRCEAATGPDRELDALIAVVTSNDPGARVVKPEAGFFFTYKLGWIRTSDDKSHLASAYTASLDVAISLIPDKINSTGEVWRAEAYSDPGVLAPHVRASAWVAGAARVYAATPALALCAAALRVRARTPSAVLQHGGGGE